VFGVFTPGHNVGDSDLVLKVQREKPLDFAFGADNFGNPFNGEYRAHAGLAWNSPLGLGDRFQLSLLKAQSNGSDSKGADTTFYSTDYRLPVMGGRAAGTVSFAKNDYAAGGALNGLIAGVSKVAEGGLEFETSRSRLGRSYVFVKGAAKRAEFSQPTGSQHERLQSGEVGFAIDHTDQSAKGRWMASVSAMHGTNSLKGLETIRASSDDTYTVGRFDLERVQRLSTYQNLRFKIAGQLTSNSLPTLEQSALGGPNSVRSYEIAHFVGDKSISGTAEWYVGAPGFSTRVGPGGHPWGQLLQFVAFYDMSKGWLNKPTAGEIADRDLKGAGLGIVVNVPSHFYMRIDASKALSPQDTDKSSKYYKSTRIYGSFGVNF
jgi:hemolysin activation/secretion protein